MIDILYEDNHCIAVAKPAPLLTQGVPPGIPTLEAMVKYYLLQRYHKPVRAYLGIPHRLDRPVSGVVLFARNTKAAQRLAEQFRERQVTKLYWGLTEGHVQPALGTWEDWLLKVREKACSARVDEGTPGARHALLDYRTLSVGSNWSLLELKPRTGRMHQLRLQSALRGWPIIGDRLYGSQRHFGPAVELPRDRIIALHARSLIFLHPIRYEPLTVTAPLPPTWNEYGVTTAALP